MTTISTLSFSDDDRAAFIRGWEAAGGYIGDIDTPRPWCMPWTYATEQRFAGAIDGYSMEELGARFWAWQRDAVEAALADELEVTEQDKPYFIAFCHTFRLPVSAAALEKYEALDTRLAAAGGHMQLDDPDTLSVYIADHSGGYRKAADLDVRLMADLD